MIHKSLTGLIACAALAAGVALSHGEPAPSSSRNIIDAHTEPFKELKLCFKNMGLIRKVHVKEGDVVEEGMILMEQDDSEDAVEMRLLEVDAKATEPIRAAEAKHRVATVEFTMKDNLLKDGANNKLEWERAKGDMEVALIQIEDAKKEQELKKLKHDAKTVHVQKMKLVSPVKGAVKDIVNREGSTVDPTKESVVLVQNDPLKVVAQIPALASLQLKKGDKLRVSYDKKTWQDATISYLSPQANAQSGERAVYLELANPKGDPSGLQVFVELPEKLLAGAP